MKVPLTSSTANAEHSPEHTPTVEQLLFADVPKAPSAKDQLKASTSKFPDDGFFYWTPDAIRALIAYLSQHKKAILEAKKNKSWALLEGYFKDITEPSSSISSLDVPSPSSSLKNAKPKQLHGAELKALMNKVYEEVHSIDDTLTCARNILKETARVNGEKPPSFENVFPDCERILEISRELDGILLLVEHHANFGSNYQQMLDDMIKKTEHSASLLNCFFRELLEGSSKDNTAVTNHMPLISVVLACILMHAQLGIEWTQAKELLFTFHEIVMDLGSGDHHLAPFLLNALSRGIFMRPFMPSKSLKAFQNQPVQGPFLALAQGYGLQQYFHVFFAWRIGRQAVANLEDLPRDDLVLLLTMIKRHFTVETKATDTDVENPNSTQSSKTKND